MTVQEKHIGWPDLERYSDTPIFNTKAVVQQTGVTAPTLRAWERRYTILSPERANNDYRLYSERDIATIRWLKDRVDDGMAISQAIALLRHLNEERYQLHPAAENTTSFQTSISTSPPVQVPGIKGDEQLPEEGPKKDLSQIDTEKPLSNYPLTHDMRSVQERLLEAFKVMDEPTADRLMASMLAIYSIEQVCIDFITPTLWEIGRLWEQKLITVSVEHFASAFFRGLLANLLHTTPVRGGPLVITCCAPGEAHELAPLMLSLLLRRSGLRVVFLGQSIETMDLLQTIQQLTPVLICISITMPSFLNDLVDLGGKLQRIPPPRPIFAFGGQIFTLHPELIAKVDGVYFEGDMQSVVAQLREMALKEAATRG